MFNDPSGRSKLDIVLDALRRRICVNPSDVELRLHENALAAEFEMSRTPIRQVLQRLAYERLVETRSGVGTIAMPMREEDRARDLMTHQGLIRAILAHELSALSLVDRSTIAALGEMARATPRLALEDAFDLRSGLLEVLRRRIPDPILEDAFQASHWRVIRRNMRDFRDDAAGATAALAALVEGAADASTQGASEVFQAVLTHDLTA